MRWLSFILLALLLVVQVDYWIGRNGMMDARRLRAQLAAVQAENEAARPRDDRVRAEVPGLRACQPSAICPCPSQARR